MSEFFEAFNPSARHWREQQQLEKMLVVDTHRAGSGPKPLDLDSGVVHLVMPRNRGPRAGDTPDDRTPGDGNPGDGNPGPGAAAKDADPS